MLLHQFMSDHRHEILRVCQQEMRERQVENAEALDPHVAQFFDEMLRAIRRDQGMRESRSPLPAGSATAAQIGEERQQAGITVSHVPVVFATISQALGKIGEQYELTLSAEEYKLLNRCLDTGVATSIENFWRKDTDSKNRQITESFGFVAHELRNALGNAKTAFALLRTGELDINGKTSDVLARNLVRMEALVAEISAAVQLQVGARPELVPLNVASVLRALVDAAIVDRSITLAVKVDETVYIAGDEMMLTSAVNNLVHNAVKFSPAGANVQLRMEVVENSVRIEVEDQCGGLRQDNPEEIFKPYVKQGDGNRTGTGLGLSIAKGAVEAMHGELSVTNHPGHGCVFSARFPLLSR
jgi:signal transduction histidine kinase